MYSCVFCNKQFKSHEAVAQHTEAKHPYPCHQCYRSFTTKEGLEQHKKAKHPKHTVAKHTYSRQSEDNVFGHKVEELRRMDPFMIKRPHALGERDTHEHLWYCFGCETRFKDHKSFNSHYAMYHHIRNYHPEFLEDSESVDSRDFNFND